MPNVWVLLMPNAPLKPCAHRLCPTLIPRGQRFCPTHSRTHYQQQDAERTNKAARRLYKTARWGKVRALVLARDPLCVLCRRAGSREVDHAVPVSDGGAMWEMGNLQALCKPCHSRKTAEEVMRNVSG